MRISDCSSDVCASDLNIGNSVEQSAQLAVAIRLGKFFVYKTGHALVMLDGTVTQHQMGEIQIPFMGRHIGALHHEAHVTEGACIHDFLEILAIEMLHILMLAFIDHIEKRGETVAQIEATP